MIISDITSLSLEIAKLLESRFISVIMFDRSEEQVNTARSHNIYAYIGNLSDPEVFRKINIEYADVIFLFSHTNESLLKTAIVLRATDKIVPILAFTSENEIEQSFAERVGITRIYSNPRIVASYISVITRQIEVAIVADQPSRDAYYYIALTFPSQQVDLQKILGEHFTLGLFNFSQLGFHNYLTPIYKEFLSNNLPINKFDRYGLLSIFPKSNYEKIDLPRGIFDSDQIDLEGRFHHIIIFGFDSMVHSMISYLRVPIDRFIIIAFTEERYNLAHLSKLQAELIHNKEDLKTFIRDKIHSDDVVFNLLTDLETALRVTIEIREKDELIPIYQLIKDKYETELFAKFHVQGVVSPELLTTRAMIQYYLRNSNYSMSSLYQGSHTFEYIIHEESPLLGKTIASLLNDDYNVLLHRNKSNANQLQDATKFSHDTILKLGDTLFLEKKR